MFGLTMQVKVSDKLVIRLAPLSKEGTESFIKNGGLQHHTVGRYLGLGSAPTIEDEQEWYDKTRASKTDVVWGIWIEEKNQWKLIGTSAVKIDDSGALKYRQAVTGSLIVDKSYWGKGIASAAHKARTWYAFNQLNLIRLRSAVALPNVGSRKALSRSGYIHHSLERYVQFVDGKPVHHENLECLNPSDLAWSTWWHDDEPTKEAIEARETTKEALRWADENVVLL